MKTGFVYIATGDQFVNEAVVSARSIKEHHPNHPITLYTDRKRSFDHDLFENITVLNNCYFHRGDTVIKKSMTPYDKNIFLDTDTYVTDELDDVFQALSKFDIAFSRSRGKKSVDDVPNCMTEYNTGVIAYNNNSKVKSFFNEWDMNYRKYNNKSGKTSNQISFLETLWEKDINYLTLPREYNVAVPHEAHLNGQAKIIHGRHIKGYEYLDEILNSTTGSRIYYTTRLFGPSSPDEIINDRIGLCVRFKNKVENDGLTPTINLIFDRIMERI